MKTIKQILLSLILPMLFLAVATTPVGFLGCRNRGLIAVVLAIISAIFALITTIISLRNRLNGKLHNPISLICTVIQALPAVYILILAYQLSPS
jgi:hypothetical protein